MTRYELIKILEKHGWVDTGRGKGSHKTFYDPATNRVTTVPTPKKTDYATGTLRAIRRQTGINEIR